MLVTLSWHAGFAASLCATMSVDQISRFAHQMIQAVPQAEDLEDTGVEQEKGFIDIYRYAPQFNGKVA